MQRFASNNRGSASIDPFIIELAAVILVFAFSCAAVLGMFSVSAKRARRESLVTDCLTIAQSACEVYTVSGSIYDTVKTVLPDAEISPSVNNAVLYLDAQGFPAKPDEAELILAFSETEKEMITDGLLCGSIYNMRVSAQVRSDGEAENVISSVSARYVPAAAVIPLGEGEADR